MFIINFLNISIAQNTQDFGLKGGLNYNSKSDYFESVSNTYKNPNSNTGFHFGVFGKFGVCIYFKLELVYTSTKSDFGQDTFKIQKLHVPLLEGPKVIGQLSLFFGGASFQYILDSAFSGITINDIEKPYSAVLNFSIGFNLKNLGVDLRYERSFSEN